MTEETPVTVRVTRRFEASAKRVFDAWLDPETVSRWLFATEKGEMLRVEIDAKVGGRFLIVERRDGEDIAHTGEYLEIDRPRRLVFTLAVEKYSQDIDRVTIEITPRGSGCELTFTHELKPQWAQQTEKGWVMLLDGLARALD